MPGAKEFNPARFLFYLFIFSRCRKSAVLRRLLVRALNAKYQFATRDLQRRGEIGNYGFGLPGRTVPPQVDSDNCSEMNCTAKHKCTVSQKLDTHRAEFYCSSRHALTVRNNRFC